MAFNISYVYHAIDRFTPVANKIKRNIDGITKKVNISRKSIQKFGQGLRSVGRNLALKVTLPIVAFAGFALKASANMETLRISLESMTGSSEKAAKVLKDLITFTARTPFQLEGVGRAAKQLLSFGVSQDKLIGKLKFLGDIAAGANVPLTDMASIFGKAKAKGKAMTEELLQLSDRGIPIIAVLAKGLKISKERIFDLASKGKISFEILQKAMIKMTEKGGIFFRQTEKQSATLAGVFSTLKDNVNIALADIGDQLVETFDLKQVLKDTISFIQRMTKSMKEFVKSNPLLSKTILIVIALSAALAPILITLGLIVAGFAALAFPIAALSAPVLVLIAVLTTALGLIAKVKGDFSDLQAGEHTRKTIQGDIEKMQAATALLLSKKGVASGAGSSGEMNGKIVVEAASGTKIQSATSSIKGIGGNLGISMAGAG